MSLIVLGCGAYGFTIGLRNGLEMGAYVAIKLPLIIFITLIANGLLNGLLGLVLGVGVLTKQLVQPRAILGNVGSQGARQPHVGKLVPRADVGG